MNATTSAARNKGGEADNLATFTACPAALVMMAYAFDALM